MSETKTTGYANRLAAVVAWHGRLSALDEEQIEAKSNEDLVADLGEAVTSHVPWLLEQVRAKDAGLTEAPRFVVVNPGSPNPAVDRAGGKAFSSYVSGLAADLAGKVVAAGGDVQAVQADALRAAGFGVGRRVALVEPTGRKPFVNGVVEIAAIAPKRLLVAWRDSATQYGWSVCTTDEAGLAEDALAEGCSEEDAHRLADLANAVPWLLDQVLSVTRALTTAGYPPLKGFSMVEAIHEMVKRITYLEGANIDATTVNDATEDALRAQVTALEADRSRFTGSHEQVVAVLNKYAVPPGDTVAARLEAVLGAANICRVCDRPRADHGGEDNGVDDGRVCDGFEPKEGTVSFAYRIRAGDRGGDGLVLQVDERDLPPVQAGDTGPITVVRLPVVPPSVQAGLDGLYLRREALGEQIDAHDTAEPPTAPPVELVREYQAVREEIATVEKAARGKPRVPVQPVAATNVTESMAFVDGPGYHGVASVPVHTYPESPQGRACFDFRKKHDVFVFHVARALRLSPADVAGLERGALTTDEEGWEEVWAALGLLALTHPDRRREEATRLAAREISTLRTLLAVDEEANATLLAALARGSAEPAGGGS